jgi:hypothetical protein
MRDIIRTLHPEKKQGVNISREKYDLIRNSILCVLQAHKEITFMKLSRAVEKEVNGKFEGSVTWYVTTVKLDMEGAESSGTKLDTGAGQIGISL